MTKMRLIAITLSVLAITTASANIIANGGFELGAGGTANGWNLAPQAAPPGAAVATRLATAPASGQYHIELGVTGAAGVGPVALALQQTATNSVTPGDIYDFSLKAKKLSNLGDGAVVFLEVQWLDSDGSNGGGVKGSTGLLNIGPMLTTSYATYGFFNKVAPAGSDAAYVIIKVAGGAFVGSNADVYFDDVTLTPEPAALVLLALGALIRRR